MAARAGTSEGQAIEAHDAVLASYRQTCSMPLAQVADTLRALQPRAEAPGGAQGHRRVHAHSVALHLTHINYQTGIATYLSATDCDDSTNSHAWRYVQRRRNDQEHRRALPSLWAAVGGACKNEAGSRCPL